MSLFTAELNDSEIRLARGCDIILRSPGIAVVNKQGLVVGQEAMEAAYLNPRETHNRHWSKLNQDALQAPARNYRHHADLVYAHLLKLHELAGGPEEILFAVPGSYTEQQLSLLLGIVSACPFDAAGLVDTAVAAASMLARPGDFQHIDMHLHYCVITGLHVDSEVTRTGVITIEDNGFVRLYSIVAGLVSDLFIQQSRFDPQHHAESEQLLYNQIPAALRTLQSAGELDLEIRYQSTTHHARLTRDVLITRLKPFYEKLISRLTPGTGLILADRMLGLPGLATFMPEYLPGTADTLFEACQAHLLAIRSHGPELSFITSLPARADAPVTRGIAPAAATWQEQAVTHVACRGLAWRLSERPVYLSAQIGISAESHAGDLCRVEVQDGRVRLHPAQGSGCRLNGSEAPDGHSPQPGDRLRCETTGTDFEFLQVMPGNGA